MVYFLYRNVCFLNLDKECESMMNGFKQIYSSRPLRPLRLRVKAFITRVN